MSDTGRQGRPPEGRDWGDNSKQAQPEYPFEDPSPNMRRRHTDADDMRRKFGIAPFDPESYEYHPYPNCLVHEADGEHFGHVGGTNFLAVGEKGSGKSTLGLHTACRLMEINDEAVVWRGSSSRSEWLPLKPWTRLLLPANADIEARWKPRDIREQNLGDEADLEDVVRDVVYYEDPM